MAIRKDLDDMLNSLKKSSNTSNPAHIKAEPKSAPKRKSVYDSMSVDDLLSALSDDRKNEAADELAEEISAEFTGERQFSPVTVSEEINVVRSSETSQQVTMSEEINVIKTAPAQEKKAESEENPAPVKKKKRIVITGELPDYEAIRQRELEKDRLAKEAAEKAAKEQAEREAKEAAERAAKEQAEREAREAVERAAKEQAEREAREAAERAAKEQAEREAREAAERAAREQAEREAREAAEAEAEQLAETNEKRKKSFFSKLKDKLNTEEEFDEPAEVTEPEPETAPEEKDELDSLIEEAEAESAENIYEPMDMEEEVPEEHYTSVEDEYTPSADELLDAALAAIHSTELVDDVQTDDEQFVEDNSDDNEMNAEEDESDPVGDMIEGMRESTENAIAELEEQQSEETDEPEEEAEPEQIPDEQQKEPEKPEKRNVLSKILDEDPDELLNIKRESAEEDENDVQPAGNRGFKRKLYALLGAVFAVFAIIGVAVVGMKCVSAIKSFTSGEVKKDGFTEIVYPAVIMDIESFNSPSELSSEQMITASIWSIIMDDSRASKYTVNPGTDTISIPYMDVEARAVEMFGTEHPTFEHCTVGPVDSKFFYSEGAYNVKLRPITFTYSPEIKSIVKSGSEYTVSVDYVDELPSWIEKSVSKSVEFKLTERDDGTYRINSMKINYVKSNI